MCPLQHHWKAIRVCIYYIYIYILNMCVYIYIYHIVNNSENVRRINGIHLHICNVFVVTPLRLQASLPCCQRIVELWSSARRQVQDNLAAGVLDGNPPHTSRTFSQEKFSTSGPGVIVSSVGCLWNIAVRFWCTEGQNHEHAACSLNKTCLL